MSKELVISTSPHETRVAKIEDGQLCEIYIEREKELALVGSIYKGRVTRVLPGMQSAFVEIGLDGDAFLYVSDFLEQVEEFDAIESTVEVKVQRMEEEGGQVFTAAETTTPVAMEPPEVLGPAPEVVAETPPASEAEAPAPAPPPKPPYRSGGFQRRPFSPGSGGSNRRGGSGDRGDRSGGGSRGRWGRGRDQGRGPDRGRSDRRFGRDLPPSKYASPHMPYEPSEATEELEPIILPGESLAKYRDKKPAAPVAHPVEPLQPEPPVQPAAELDSGNQPEPAAVEPMDERDSQMDFFPPYFPPTKEEPRKEEERPVWAPRVESEVPSGPKSILSASDDSTKDSVQEETPVAEIDSDDAETHELSQDEIQTIAGHIVEEKIEEHAASDEEEDDDDEGSNGGIESGEPEEADDEESATAEFGQPSEAAGDSEGEQEFDQLRSSSAEGTEAPADEGQAPEPYVQRAPTDDKPRGSTRMHEDSRPRFQRPMRRGGEHKRGGRPPQRRFQGRGDRGPQASRKPQLISELLKPGQEIIVQIAKEPLGKKGARITSHVALPGRFLVYMPTVDHIGVSRKIASAEQRSRLRRLVLETKGAQNFPGGFIVRTAAQSATDEDIRTDVEYLGRSWQEIRNRAEQRKAPSLLHRDLNLVERILRDYLSPDYSAIWIDSEEEFTKVVEFVGRFQPQLVSRVKLYGKETPIFEEFGIQQEIDKALRPKVWLKSGGYIVINHTEALVAIDVNTGKFVGKGSTRLEDTIVKTNLEAVKEIVRQIRLRDLGGIIVLDFIDMEERRNREKVLAALHDALRSDRAPSKVLSFNEFGLVAITRKRTKQALERVLCQPCPYCAGSGMVKSVPTLCYEIQAEARKMAAELDSPSLTLRVHPEIAKTLKTRESGLIEQLEQWTKKSVIIQADPTLHWEQFDIF